MSDSLSDSVVVTTYADIQKQILGEPDPATEKPAEEQKPSEATPEEKPETEPDSDTGEPDEQDDGEPDEQAKKKGKGGFQRTINKKTREIYSLRAQITELEARLAEKPAAQPEQKTAEGKPTPDKFETYEEFLEALSDYKVEQRAKQFEQAENQRKANEQQKAQLDTFQERLSEARSRYTDFDEVVGAQIPISQAMQQTILESDKGADLAYWLGSNPEESARIAKLSPFAAAKELGKIEARFEAKPEPKKQAPVSKAPPPITPLASQSPAGSTKSPDEMTLAEYEAWRASGGGKRR